MIEPTITFDKIQLFNADNMKVMKQYPDKYFDIAIVDPEYGININNNIGRRKGDKHSGHKKVKWDSKPPEQIYFDELKRVSKNQIIWGGNYFNLTPTKCFLIWYKPQISVDVSFSMCELAWTSFDTSAKLFEYYNKENKIHPTQKPVALYSWIIKNYVKPNMKILDTHLGSGSQTIAIDKANTIENMNLEFVGIEIDSEYFNDSVRRFKNYKQQKTIFD